MNKREKKKLQKKLNSLQFKDLNDILNNIDFLQVWMDALIEYKIKLALADENLKLASKMHKASGGSYIV